ncbi:MAG: hypothetical protein C0392_09320 [Syntrophus sp. (in: bacteria)]|nr:hypothetical protein [Syntrophus sp. (in: bacteria)]
MLNRSQFYRFFIAVLIVSFAIFTGCAKPPAEEMAKAEKAIEDAKQKEAAVYVPDLLAKAEESLKKAKDYITAKKYKEAKQAAIETEGLAQQAVAGIAGAKAKMKADAEQAVQDIQKTIDDTKAAVTAVEKDKALAKAREEVQAMITKWETDLAATKEKLGQKVKEGAGDLKAMKDQIAAKKDEVTTLLTPPAKPAPAAKKK